MHHLAGRKTTVGNVLGVAGVGCVTGVATFGVGELVGALGAADVTGILSEHVAAASERFAVEGFTPGQLDALARNPELEAAFRGERIDTFAKETASRDPRLEGIQITRRFQLGPDFIDPASGRLGDITTSSQWAAHELNYGSGGTIVPY